MECREITIEDAVDRISNVEATLNDKWDCG